jgi:cell division protein FtsQ
MSKWQVMLIIAGLCLATALAIFLHNANIFPIKKVAIYGDFSPARQKILQQTVNQFTKKSFFTADLSVIKERLQSFIWVANVEVRRVWHNQLSLHIDVQRPIAKFNDNKFLNAFGEIFTQQALEEDEKNIENLPLFYGNEDQAMKLLYYYQQANVILSPIAFKVKKIKLNNADDLTIELDNGIKIKLGHERVLDKLRKFVKVYHKIFNLQDSHRSEVDLRYEHGMAVKW